VAIGSLANTNLKPAWTRDGDNLIIQLPAQPLDKLGSVFTIDISGAPDLNTPPEIKADSPVFIGSLAVTLSSSRDGVEVRYTMDGTEPTAESPVAKAPVELKQTATIAAACFRAGKRVSPVESRTFTKVEPRAAVVRADLKPGLKFTYYEFEEDIKTLDAVASMTPAATGTAPAPDLSQRRRDKRWAVRYEGFVRVPEPAVYTFATRSDDGSRLKIGGELVVENDGAHSFREQSGRIALAAGLHPITIEMFENWGGFDLQVLWSHSGVPLMPIPSDGFSREAVSGE
jgi:hypothetical protein